MKQGIVLIVLSVMLFVIALFVGIQTKNNPVLETGSGSGSVGSSDAVPTVVLPPEQLSQFKNMSIYTPKKKVNRLYIDPPNEDLKPSKEESDKIKPGVM